MRRPFFWAMAFAAILTPVLAHSAEPTLADIERVWREREKVLQSGRIEWIQKTLHTRGSLSILASDKGRVFPLADMTVEAKKAFAWDEQRKSFRTEGQTASSDGTGFVALVAAEAFDGTGNSRTLRKNASVAYVQGSIETKGDLPSRDGTSLLPVLLWIRPLDKQGGSIDLQSGRLLAEKRTIEGRPCLVVRKDRGGLADEWSIDVERGFTIARYEALKRDQKPVVRIDLSYSQDAKAGWKLATWHVIHWNRSGALSTDVECTTTVCDLDAKPAPKTFEIDFPVGAWVEDRPLKLDYILLADGTKRYVTQGEHLQGARYSELMRTNSGLARSTPPSRWRAWVLWPAVLILAATFIAWTINRARAHQLRG